MPRQTRGKFIAVEGIDGIGKTTLIKKLINKLVSDGVCDAKDICFVNEDPDFKALRKCGSFAKIVMGSGKDTIYVNDMQISLMYLADFYNIKNLLLKKLKKGSKDWKEVNKELQSAKLERIENQFDRGEITIDKYGRNVPKHAHGTQNLDHYTSSSKIIGEAIIELYERIIDKRLYTRRINISANNLINEKEAEKKNTFEQIDLFTDYSEVKRKQDKEKKEYELQKSILSIKRKYGKNAILKGMNFEEGATTIDRNSQVGGHKG